MVVLHGRRRFLVDCGEGTQRQLFASGIGLRRLDCVLLTHAHLDHLLGIGGLVATLALLEAGRSLTVYGGAPALRAVRSLLAEVVWPGGPPPFEVKSLFAPGTIIEDDHLRVRAFPVTHRTDNFGFAFEEKPAPRMLPERWRRSAFRPDPSAPAARGRGDRPGRAPDRAGRGCGPARAGHAADRGRGCGRCR